MNEKQCNTCKKVKDLSLFHKRKSSKDGLHNTCKECISIRQKEIYRLKKEGKYTRKLKRRYPKDDKRHPFIKWLGHKLTVIGVTPREFAQESGYNQEHIRLLLAGKRKCSYDFENIAIMTLYRFLTGTDKIHKIPRGYLSYYE